MNWLHYLLEANIYLGVFYVAYCLFLNKETHYLLNRLYLVLSSMVSFILPVLQLGILLPPIPEPTTVSYSIAEQVTNVPASIAVPEQVAPVAPSFTFEDGLWYTYLAGTVVLLALLVIKLYSLFKLIRTHKVTVIDNYKLVHIKDTNTAFSFFNYLFIGSRANKAEIILRHELVHIRQKHSADIIFLEILKIINWFNPLVYLLQNSLKTQHEYIADEQTVVDEADATSYSSFLVNNAYGLSGPAITHSFYNLNLLKNRIIMLHQQRSGNLAKLKYLVAVPIGAVLLCTSTLGFSKTYGWIDLAPYSTDSINEHTNIERSYRDTSMKNMVYETRLDGPIIVSGDNILYVPNSSKDDLYLEADDIYYAKKTNKTAISEVVRKWGNKAKNGVFELSGSYKISHIDAAGNTTPIIIKQAKSQQQKPKVGQLKFRSEPIALVPVGFKPQKIYVNTKGYKIEEGAGKNKDGRTWYLVKITHPSGKNIDGSNKQFVAYKGMTEAEKIADTKFGYKFPDVKVSKLLPPPPEPPKPKIDQVRFPPPIVIPDVPADFTPEKSYVNEKGYKIEEGPYTVDDKTYYVATISDNSTGTKIGSYYKGVNEKRIKPILLNKYGYEFPDVVVSTFQVQPPPPEPPKFKMNQVKFPPPIVKPDKSSPKPKVDQVRFPPPIVKPDKSAPGELKVADKRTTDVVKFPPPTVKPFSNDFMTFLGKNVRYPAEAKEKGTKGYVSAEITINDYMITNSRIVKGIGDGCDDEILRALNAYKSKMQVKSGTYLIAIAFNLVLGNDAYQRLPEIDEAKYGPVLSYIYSYGPKK